MIEILSKNIIHHVLEDYQSVGKAELHHFVVELSIVGCRGIPPGCVETGQEHGGLETRNREERKGGVGRVAYTHNIVS